MIKLIIYILLIYVAYKVIKGLTAPSVSTERREERDAGPVDDIMIKDPVCGVYFPKKDGIYLNADGRDMYFCSNECRDRFVDSSSKK